MKIYAVGSRAFVTGFVLAGVNGEYVSSPEELLEKVEKLSKDTDTGLIIVELALSRKVRDAISSIRSSRPVPLVYEVPGPGSKQEKIDYRSMLRQILGV